MVVEVFGSIDRFAGVLRCPNESVVCCVNMDWRGPVCKMLCEWGRRRPAQSRGWEHTCTLYFLSAVPGRCNREMCLGCKASAGRSATSASLIGRWSPHLEVSCLPVLLGIDCPRSPSLCIPRTLVLLGFPGASITAEQHTALIHRPSSTSTVASSRRSSRCRRGGE